MVSKDNKRSLTVGLFALIGLIILVAGILVLGSQQSKFGKHVNVTSYFEDVKGLKVGNNVWFSGVRVGIVKEIKFEDIQRVRVAMQIEEKALEFIRKDVVAKLGSDGLIGNSIVTLVGGSASQPSIESGDVLVSEKGTDTEQMFATLQINNENLVEVTKNLALLSKELVEGKGPVGALLTDSTWVYSLNNTLKSLSLTMENAGKATQEVHALTKKLNSDEGLIHELATDTSVFNSLRTSAAQLQGITQTASAMVVNLEEMSEKLGDKDNAVGALTNDKEVADEIRQVITNLNEASLKLDENMEALQHNFLLRGFFRKKRKAEEKAQKEQLQEEQLQEEQHQ